MVGLGIWEGSLGGDAERSLEAKKGGTVRMHEGGNVGQDEHENDDKLRFDFDSCQTNLQ
jgi:hypothetical protein